jgi:hypothetical protein
VGAEKPALGHKGLRQLSAAVSLALGLPEEFILERAAATGDAKWTPPADDRPRRKSARRTINGWLKDPNPTVEYIAPGAFQERDSQVMQEAVYKFGAVGAWLPVDPRPVIFSDESAGLGDLQLVLQYTKQIVATRHMQISGRWVYRDPQDGNWTNYSPRPRMTPDEYCDLLERKISLLTVRIIAEAMVAAEANRKRVVAEWLADRRHGPFPLHGSTDNRGIDGLDLETIKIMADESRESRGGPRPGPNDAWGRKRVSLDDEDNPIPDHQFLDEESRPGRKKGSGDAGQLRVDHADPTLDAVLLHCGDWPQPNPTAACPTDNVAALPIRHVVRLGGGVSQEPVLPAWTGPAASSGGRRAYSWIRARNRALDAGETVTNLESRVESISSIECVVPIIEVLEAEAA